MFESPTEKAKMKKAANTSKVDASETSTDEAAHTPRDDEYEFQNSTDTGFFDEVFETTVKRGKDWFDEA